MNDTPAAARASTMDLRLRRAIPAFGAKGPARLPADSPPDASSTLTLARRAWPYIYRYIGGRWIGLGAGRTAGAPDSGGYLFMPVLVTALSLVAFLATPPAGTPRTALFWSLIGHGLGLALAVLAWLTWLTRGRWRAATGAAGAAVGLVMATLLWISAPGLGGKLLGVALLAAYVSGAALRLRLRGGFAVWLRIESHLVYYYAMFALCSAVVALNTAFLTDILYQSVLSGRPLTLGFASLIGRPELAHGTASYLGQHYLAQPARHLLQFYYVGLYFAGWLFSLPTLLIGLPYYWTFIHQKINQDCRLDLMERWQRLSPRYHTRHRVGDSIYRIYLDSAQVSNIISRLQISFMYGTGWISACFIGLFFDWRLAALAAGMAAPILAFAFWYTPRLKARALASREATSDLTSRAQEVLSSVRVIKAYGQEEREQAAFEADSVSAFEAALGARWLFVLAGVVTFIIAALFMLPMEYLMAVWASEGRATLAAGLIALIGLSFSRWNVAAFTWASTRFGTATVQIRDLNTEWAAAQDNVMGLKRVFDILDTEPEVQDAPGAGRLRDFSRDIRFENVSFGYEPGAPILKDVSFSAGAGSVTAIVGPTGSGKSTLMALLLRLFETDRGRILIDGVDVREVTVESLRAQIAVAPQEPVLFAASVADNLRYATHDADADAVAAAAAIACADDFVQALPHSWDTLLGERGAGLSPGQKQRLCIARALIKQAPILILDEPTASLDAETEHRLMQNLSRWAQGRIVFIITHRLSTIRRADQILLIEDGRVVEAGGHGALMADAAGRYRAMVAAEQGLAGMAAV